MRIMGKETKEELLAKFFLARFKKFVDVDDFAKKHNIKPELKKLARTAILSGYRDCVSVGLKEEAERIMSRVSDDKPLV